MPRDNKGLRQPWEDIPASRFDFYHVQVYQGSECDGGSGVFLTIQQQRGEVR